MKKSYLIVSLILFISLFFFAISRALADQSATDAAIQNIKEHIQKQNDPQIQGLETQMTQQKFGIIGTLEKIIGSTLQIRTQKGDLRVAELDRSAIILSGQKPIARTDLELNTPVIVMGFKQSDGSLLARRLIISDDTIFGTKRTTIYGTAVSITTKLLTLLSFTNGQITSVPVKITTKTTYFNLIDGAIKRTDIKPQDPVIAVLPDGDIASTSAVRVYSLSPAAVPSPSILPLPSPGN